MRFVKDFVVFGICFTFLCRVASQDICQQVHGDGVALHTSYKDGNRSCCKIIPCSAGFEAVMCRSDDPFSTYCQPCPPNTFESDPTSSVDMKYCDSKQTCPAGMKVEDDDSSIKDRRCLCDLEKGNCNPSKNRSYCQRRNCPAGMGLNQDCSCTECEEGFFKDVNGSMPCKPWRNCIDEGRTTAVQGTTVTDVVCGNSTDNRGGEALSVTKALMTTASSVNIFTSDLSTAHSTKSSPNSSAGLDHTTLQNETSQNWTPVAIAIGVLAVVAILVVIFLCVKRKIAKCCIFVPDKTDRPVEQHRPAEVTDVEARLIPQPPIGQIGEAQHEEEREIAQLLTGGDTGHDDPQRQDGVCSTVEREDAATVRQERESVEENNPYSNMTHAMKESLRRCRVILLESLVVNAVFLSVLNTNNTITDEMRHAIQNESTPNSRNDKLLDFLPKRPCLSYKTFVFALVCTNQSHLARQIDAELAKEYAAYVKSGGNVADKVISFGCL